jgi:hypothetical protein
MNQVISEGHCCSDRNSKHGRPCNNKTDLDERFNLFDLGELLGNAWKGVMKHERKYEVGENITEIIFIEKITFTLWC